MYTHLSTHVYMYLSLCLFDLVFSMSRPERKTWWHVQLNHPSTAQHDRWLQKSNATMASVVAICCRPSHFWCPWAVPPWHDSNLWCPKIAMGDESTRVDTFRPFSGPNPSESSKLGVFKHIWMFSGPRHRSIFVVSRGFNWKDFNTRRGASCQQKLSRVVNRCK